MTRKGDTVEHPVTGERITFLDTSEETNGEYAVFELPACGPTRAGSGPGRERDRARRLTPQDGAEPGITHYQKGN